ncbi:MULTISPECIES: hypothetical protein [unclassified Streptomyces]|uniref:hypothetical protein n=1 Tax=unclassified Streptomyces TaxID=2593676 RepID=UPI0037FE6466
MTPRSGPTPKPPGGSTAGEARSVSVPPAGTALPATTGWLLRGKDGRLTAYAPTDGGVLRWTEARVGGPGWAGPDLLAVAGLLPYLSVAQSAEGFVHLLGVRARPCADGPDELDLVHAIQFQTGRPLRDWQSLGNPHGKDRAKGAQIGMPSHVLDDTGSVQLFLRNTNGGLSAKRQAPSGRWHPWGGANPRGTLLTGESAAAVTDHGTIDLLVPAGDAVVRWLREKADGELVRAEDEPRVKVAPGTITAERTGPGRLTHFWRDAGNGTVRAWRPGAEPASLGGRGTGPPALLRTPVDGYDCTILAQRGTDGHPSIAAYPTEHEEAGLHWTRTGERCAGAPALALDGLGRVVLAAIGEDGTLRVTRQKAEPGLALEPWTRI